MAFHFMASASCWVAVAAVAVADVAVADVASLSRCWFST